MASVNRYTVVVHNAKREGRCVLHDATFGASSVSRHRGKTHECLHDYRNLEIHGSGWAVREESLSCGNPVPDIGILPAKYLSDFPYSRI